MKSNSSLLKGSLQTIILTLLKQKEKMYGYEITQKVKELTQGDIVIKEGALYPALHKLEDEGILITSLETVDNRIRKYYALSAEGRAQVEEKISEAKNFIENLELLMNLQPKLL